MSKKARLTRRQFLVGASATLAGLLIPPQQRSVPTARAMGQKAPSVTAANAIVADGIIADGIIADGIIADHTVVDQYQNIPQQYIDLVKQMWVQVIGESHSGAYRYGVNLLAAQDPDFPAVGQEGGVPNPPTNANLRVSRTWWFDDPARSGGLEWNRYGGGEEDFWTTQWAIDNVKTNISYCNGAGNNPVAAVGFAWCWDMVGITTNYTDPVYGCRWGGRSYYWNGTSFQNAGGWGLDDEDKAMIDPTGTRPNIVSMQDYIDAIIEINNHDPNTICFFTTGPVDNLNDTRNEGQSGYQRYIKHEYLRNHIRTNGGVLFDFADILSHNNVGVQQTTTWEDHTFPIIHPDNDGEYNGGAGSCHIGEEGCVRIAKALWWMLAHIAGWEAVADTQAPTSPSSLTAMAVSPTQVDLDWVPSTDDVGVVGYRIYRDGAPAGTSATTSFSDVGLTPDTPYSYTITARDAAGNESESSNVANVTTPDVPSCEIFIPIVSK